MGLLILMLERFIASTLIILLSPLFCFLYIIVKTTSKGPFIFVQKRAGKNQTPFVIYKIRTMDEHAEELKKHYRHLNQADGPVFKIFNDPRYTKIGKWMSKTGLDELPQLINIVKGEMSFVGPRPLPIEEAANIPDKYKMRFNVLPGITSLWVINGSHSLSFKQWMELDKFYTLHKSVLLDMYVIYKTLVFVISSLLYFSTRQTKKSNTF